MAQDNYGGLFMTESSDIQELDQQLNVSSIDDDADDIILATADDKKNAKKLAEPKKAVVKPEEEVEEPEVPIIDEMDEESAESKPATKPNTKPGEQITEELVLSEMAVIAEGLFKAGIWNRDEDEDETYFPDTQEDFAERFDYESKKLANNYVSQIATRHGEDAQELFDAVFVKGAPIKEYVTRWQENQDFKSLDMTQEENQLRVVQEMYKQQGIPQDKVNEKIRKLKLSEDLEDEANTYHGILVKRQDENLSKLEEQSRIAKEQKKASRQQELSTIDSTFSEKLKSQDFDGIPVNSKTVEIAKEMIKTDKWKLKDGTLVTDWDRMMMDLQSPMNYETKMKLALLFKPYVPGKPLELNLQTVAKKAVSNQTAQMFNLGKAPKRTVPETKKMETSGLDISDLWK